MHLTHLRVNLNSDPRKQLYACHAQDILWREWEGLFAAFNRKDESTHFIDPLGSLVFECLSRADGPLAFDNLVSSVLFECGEDTDAGTVVAQLEECLPQLQRIGLVKAVLREE